MLGTIPPLTLKVNAVDIKTIMDVMGDINPIHVDEELALSLGLRGCVNQGPANLGYVINMLIDWAGEPQAITNLKVRFHSISCPGDQLEARGFVEELFVEQNTLFAKCALELIRTLKSEIEKTELILNGTAIVKVSDKLKKMIDQNNAR